MKLIIAGSRDIEVSPEFIRDVINHLGLEPTQIVNGGASGIDSAGQEYANKYNISSVTMQALWKKHGKAAGPIRNRTMAEYADTLLLIWDGKSRGSSNMRKEMNKLNKPVFEVIIKK